MSDVPNGNLENDDEKLWRLLQDSASDEDFSKRCAKFLAEARDPRGIVYRKLRGSVPDAFRSLSVLKRMNEADRAALFQELLWLCLSQKFGKAARSIITAMAREWVLLHIWSACEKILERADSIVQRVGFHLSQRIGSQGNASFRLRHS